MYQPGLGFLFGLTEKLDGVGPVDNRPSTDKLPGCTLRSGNCQSSHVNKIKKSYQEVM